MVPRNPSPPQPYNCIKSHHGDDPDYILFLNHLSPDRGGASYTLRINNNIIAYEDQDRGGSSFNYYSNINSRKDTNDGDHGNFKDVSDPDDASADGDYLRFLQHLKMRADGSVSLQIGGSVVVYANDDYDDGGDGDGDEEVEKATVELTVEREEEKGKLVQIEDPKRENHSPPLGKEVPADVLGGEVLSSFKSRLMESLKRPFDQREYDRLLTEAKKRKPIVKFKHLRTEDVPYETDELGASYFHHYPDLRRKVKSADHVGGLMLLRGFFFWLQNLDHKGAYKPWESTL